MVGTYWSKYWGWACAKYQTTSQISANDSFDFKNIFFSSLPSKIYMYMYNVFDIFQGVVVKPHTQFESRAPATGERKGNMKLIHFHKHLNVIFMRHFNNSIFSVKIIFRSQQQEHYCILLCFWAYAAQALPTCSGITIKGSKFKHQHCCILFFVQGPGRKGPPYLFWHNPQGE